MHYFLGGQVFKDFSYLADELPVEVMGATWVPLGEALQTSVGTGLEPEEQFLMIIDILEELDHQGAVELLHDLHGPLDAVELVGLGELAQ